MNKLTVTTPFISHHPGDDYLFSLISDQSDHFYEVVMDKYVRHRYSYSSARDYFSLKFHDEQNWSAFKSLEYFFMPRRLVEKNSDGLIQLVEELIDVGYLVFTYYNQFYVDINANYLTNHYPHELMLFGYDEDLFFVKEFLGGYRELVVKKIDFQKSIEKYDKTRYPRYDIGITGIRKKDNYKYSVNINSVLREHAALLSDKFAIDKDCDGIGIFDFELLLFDKDVSMCKDADRLNSLRLFFSYMKNSLKLLNARINFLDEVSGKPNDILLRECKNITDRFSIYYGRVMKKRMKEIFKIDEFKEVIEKEKEAYRVLVERFIENTALIKI